MALILENFCS